jgi:hypothetical protein
MDRNRLFMENIFDNFHYHSNNYFFLETVEEINSQQKKIQSFNKIIIHQHEILNNISIIVPKNNYWIENFTDDTKKIYNYFEKINNNHYIWGFLTTDPLNLNEYKIAQINIIDTKGYVTYYKNFIN